MNNLFGTDGIRARMGRSPFIPHELIQFGFAIGSWIVKKYGSNASILLATDTRISGSLVKASLKTGILHHQLHCVDAQILPTPALFKVMQETKQFDVGIMISASHNPYQDNGIKIIDAKHGKLSQHDEIEISQLYTQQINPIDYDQLGTDTFFTTAHKIYSDAIKNYFPPNFLKNYTIVLDCANGATFNLAPKIFKHYGAHVTTLNTTPNGKNINDDCGAVYPSQLQKAVKKQKAHIGFAFDGDGDRVVCVNKEGRVKDGDDILALLSGHPRYKKEQTIVATIMSNYGLEQFAMQKGKTLIRTAVGDKHVAHQMSKDNGLLGGEQSGHIILGDFLSMGDGIFAALRVAQTMIESKNWQLETFQRFPQILINIKVKQKKGLDTQPLQTIIAAHKTQLQNGRLIVRYSGTENVLRIMIEDKQKNHAQIIGKQLAHALQKELL